MIIISFADEFFKAVEAFFNILHGCGIRPSDKVLCAEARARYNSDQRLLEQSYGKIIVVFNELAAEGAPDEFFNVHHDVKCSFGLNTAHAGYGIDAINDIISALQKLKPHGLDRVLRATDGFNSCPLADCLGGTGGMAEVIGHYLCKLLV